MKIQLGEWAITADENQYILNRVHVAKTGKRKGQLAYTAVGYYMKLEHLLGHLVGKIIYDSEATTLSELWEDLRRARKMIKNKSKCQCLGRLHPRDDHLAEWECLDKGVADRKPPRGGDVRDQGAIPPKRSRSHQNHTGVSRASSGPNRLVEQERRPRRRLSRSSVITKEELLAAADKWNQLQRDAQVVAEKEKENATVRLPAASH